MQPLADDPGRADGVLGIRRDSREARVAARDGLLPLERVAAQVAELVSLELEADVELHPDVGVLAEQAAMPGGLKGRLPRRYGSGRWRCGREVGGRGGRDARPGGRDAKPVRRGQRRQQPPLPLGGDERRARMTTEPPTGVERRIPWRCERRDAERRPDAEGRAGAGIGSGSLRVDLGYEGREGEQHDQRGAPHAL